MIVESVTVFASGFMPVFRRDYVVIEADGVELFFKASSEFFQEDVIVGSVKIGDSTLWFRKRSDKGVLVMAREGDASLLVETLERNLLPVIDRVLTDEKTLRKLVDRLVIATVGVETYVRSFMSSLRAVVGVVYRNRETKVLVGEGISDIPRLPRSRRDVLLRFEDGYYVAAIPLPHGYLVVRCRRTALDLINELIEVLRFDYPEVLLEGDDLALYRKLKDAYRLMYPDNPDLLLADIDSLLRRGLTVSEAVHAIAKAYGVEPS